MEKIRMDQLKDYVRSLQESATSQVWSRGVALSRQPVVSLESESPDEFVLRVRSPNRPVSQKVTLWPAEEDAYCDCRDRDDPCVHVIAAAVALQSGKLAQEAGSPVEYHFESLVTEGGSKGAGVLHFKRLLNLQGVRKLLRQPLVRLVSGIQSGRESAPELPATKDDFAADLILKDHVEGPLPSGTLVPLLKSLGNTRSIFLDGRPIRVVETPLGAHAVLEKAAGGFRLKIRRDPRITTLFRNGAALWKRGNDEVLLSPFELPELNLEEKQALQEEGIYFSYSQKGDLYGRVVPELEKKLEVRRLGFEPSELDEPRLIEVNPVLAFEMTSLDRNTLKIVPAIEYQDSSGKTLARSLQAGSGTLELLEESLAPLRLSDEEKKLEDGLIRDFQMRVGAPVQVRGDDAISLRKRLSGYSLRGDGVDAFIPKGKLVPNVRLKSSGEFEGQLRFSVSNQSDGSFADAGEVLAAFERGSQYVPLSGGGFAELPSDWLERHGRLARQLLGAKDQPLSPALLIAAARELEYTGETKVELEESLRNVLHTLDSGDLSAQSLPKNLRAEPRSYQKDGIAWLQFMKAHQLGALLADDMGLGKTLQAISILEDAPHANLVVCPTSVLHSWKDQIKRFRPELSVNLYHGPARSLEKQNAQVVLTSYGILRQDLEKLEQHRWAVALMDESHLIKNPESRMARAAHSLSADFRLALSGTPIENRVDDLWSQFAFLNPGLLGRLEEFRQFSGRSSAGVQSVQEKVRPFILRRTKSQVAPDLPPRTEQVLYSDFTTDEAQTYQAVLAATRSELRKILDEGSPLFSALEALLRLRQACCHPSLVPGTEVPPGQPSSKLDLLMENLEECAASGNRALVFSQWTRMLDLIEPRLRTSNLPFLRIDGSTSNRGEIVDQFQSPDGPPVLLMSLKAGGVGLTLTAADHVFLMDPWWNPKAEDQAADRAHRIGQEKPVFIYRLIARNTIEESILELQSRKRELADALLENDGQAKSPLSLGRDDIALLLSSLES